MKPIFSLLLVLSLASLSLSTTAFKAVGDEDGQCVYTLYVQTGDGLDDGTDSIISVAFGAGPNGSGKKVQITDLVSWGGLMGLGHHYFQRGNLDIFSGRAPCLPEPPCWMNLTSDGSGPFHAWYCKYVKVTITSPDVECAQQAFEVEQFLSTDLPPWQLYAVRDKCTPPEAAGSGQEEVMSREVLAMRAGA